VFVIMVSNFCSLFHIVIILNGIMKRNLKVKVKNLNLKLPEEKELKKMKFVWKNRK